jgi:hypothetical protein
VRTSGEPRAVARAVRDVIREIDRALPMYDTRWLDGHVDIARADSLHDTRR